MNAARDINSSLSLPSSLSSACAACGPEPEAKNTRNDAQAILIAALQPDMRFVSVESVEQQSILVCHRMREGWRSERTALINRVRGLLVEFGIRLGRSPQNLARSLPRLIQDEQVPPHVRALLVQAQEHLGQLQHLMDQIPSDFSGRGAFGWRREFPAVQGYAAKCRTRRGR